MTAKEKSERIRRKEEGFVGANLAPGGDMKLITRLDAYAKKTTMNRSLLIRLALTEYLEKHDK